MKTTLLVFLLACAELWAQPAAQVPAPAAAAPVAAALAAPAAPPEETVPAGTIDFRGADLDAVLDVYAQYVKRTILRPAGLPAQKIFLTTQTPLTKKEIIQALDAVLSLNGISVLNFGDKFVKVVPNGGVGQEGAAFSTNDVSKFADIGPYVTHVVQLKYVRPSDMTQVIAPFAKLPGGILAIDASQILVLRDNTENVKRMLEMINRVDVDVPSEILSEVIPMKYAKATEIASALSSLSSGGGGGVTSFGGSRGTPATRGAVPGGMNRAGGYGGYPGANPTGMPQPIGAPGGLPGGLQGAANQSLQGRLSSIINRAASAGDFQILGPTKIIPDERMNSLLIFASRQDMTMITNIIAKLDTILAQVLIESIIMEVSLDDSRNVGISYLQHPQQAGNFTGVGAVNNVPFLRANNFASGVSNTASILPSGFSYFGTIGNDFDVTMQAVASDSRINVLSRPRIQTSHAVPGHIFIGQTVPFITSSYTGAYGGTGSSSSYQNEQVGITLDVTPYINPEGLVVMDISQTVSQLGNSVLIDGNPVPTTTERDANATVAVRNHDTIMLGGFISTSKSKSNSGVPLLKDLPILGALFRSSNDTSQRVELIVLIRPTVLPTPEAAATAAVAVQNQLPGVRQAQKEIQAEDDKLLKKADKKLGAPKTEAIQRDVQGRPLSP